MIDDERAIAQIASKEPLADTGQGYGYACLYCRATAQHPGYPVGTRYEHVSDCPWPLLVALAERNGWLAELKKEREAAAQRDRDEEQARIEAGERAELERLRRKFG